MACTNCGAVQEEDEFYCGSCGAKQVQEPRVLATIAPASEPAQTIHDARQMMRFVAVSIALVAILVLIMVANHWGSTLNSMTGP